MKIVRTYATSANVGTGFDCLGICFDIFNEYSYEISDKYLFDGFQNKYCSPNTNMIIKSYEYVLTKYDHNIVYLKLKQLIQNIPSTRGLGSSASCIVCGILIANNILNNILSKDDMFQLASEIEGHPDNVAPLIYGGFTSSFYDDKYYKVKLNINNNYKFYVCIPPFELSTSLARSVIPQNVSLKTAVSNISHSIAMVKALENGDIELLKIANKDLLHEKYRYPLINNANIFKKFALKNNAICVISGAGPTLLIISCEKMNFNFDLRQWIVKEVHINDIGAYIYEK